VSAPDTPTPSDGSSRVRRLLRGRRSGDAPAGTTRTDATRTDATRTDATRAGTTRVGSGVGIRPLSTQAWTDTAVLVALSALALLGFQAAFSGTAFLVAGIGGLLVGAATAIAAAVLRLNVIATVLVAVVAYFLLGTPFAVPSQAVAGVLPSLAAFASLAVGAVFGWADTVTLQTPIGAPVYIAVVPYAACFVVTVVAVSLAVRWLPGVSRAAWRLGLLLIGPVLLYVAGILTGTDAPVLAALRGIAFAVIALVWIAWRPARQNADAAAADSDGRRRLRTRKLAGTAVLVAGAIVIGGGAAAVTSPTAEQRFVLREEIEPPFDPLQFPSPLSGFREYSKLQREDALFTVEGLLPGDRVRLATMDTFSGKLWNVTGPETQTDGSGSFALVGRSLPRQRFVTAERRDLTFRIEGYDDVWVPSIGYPTRLDFTEGDAVAATDELRYNAATGTSVLTTGLSAGDAYRVSADVQRVLTPEQLAEAAPAAVALPPVIDNPDITTSKAQEFAGGATAPADQLEAIRLTLAERGFLSHGLASDTVPSRAGHGADRIDDLLSRNQMIGDEEQYASAFALMATTFGYPARVVMGFAPEVAEGVPAEVTGRDVTAWAEVAFDGVGWVAYDPTPEETDIPQDQTPRPQIEPQPQVRQPPRAESEPEDLLTPVELDEEDTDDEDRFVIPGWVLVFGIGLIVLAAIVFLPLLIVGALKARRMRRRREAATGDQQAAGAWDELLDRYAELGYAVPGRVTRPMVAASLQQQVAEPTRLGWVADSTDAAVFSGADVAPERTDGIWDEAIAAVEVARGAVTRGRRLLSRYRLRRSRRARARRTASGARPQR